MTFRVLVEKKSGLTGFSLSGFSLVELLITVGILGLISVMGLAVLLDSPDDDKQRVRAAGDFIHHLNAACNIVKARYGTGPLHAKIRNEDYHTSYTDTDPEFVYKFTSHTYADAQPNVEDPANDTFAVDDDDPNTANNPNISDFIPKTWIPNDAYRGMALFLPDWESTVTHETGPDRLEYPGKVVLYLKPDEAGVADPNNQIPNDGVDGTWASNDTVGFLHDDLMYYDQSGDHVADSNDIGYDDREFLLLDMDGPDGPNNIENTSATALSDRILLHVNDQSCEVLTAYQLCARIGCTQAYKGSFYDYHKGYCDTSPPDDDCW